LNFKRFLQFKTLKTFFANRKPLTNQSQRSKILGAE